MDRRTLLFSCLKGKREEASQAEKVGRCCELEGPNEERCAKKPYIKELSLSKNRGQTRDRGMYRVQQKEEGQQGSKVGAEGAERRRGTSRVGIESCACRIRRGGEEETRREDSGKSERKEVAEGAGESRGSREREQMMLNTRERLRNLHSDTPSLSTWCASVTVNGAEQWSLCEVFSLFVSLGPV
jgi:hypothetical protein